MGVLADRLDNMVVRVTSPDNMIMAKVQDRDQVSLAFRPGAYERYETGDLEHQLARLATLAWTGYQRGYFAALSEASGQTHTYTKDSWDPNRRRFREEWSGTVFEGRSAQGHVRCRNTGMLDWQVRIRPGITRRLAEPEFLSEAVSAVDSLVRDYRRKVILLKDEHYGLNLPPWMRRAKEAREGRGEGN